MYSCQQKSVLDKALEQIDSPKGWLILTGVVVGGIMLHKTGILDMYGYQQRDVLEKVIDKVSK